MALVLLESDDPKGYTPAITSTEWKERGKVVILTDDDLPRSKLT